MRNKYWLGFFIAICLHGFVEDILGKERYLKLVEDGWVNTPWWIWLVAIAVISGLDWYADYLKAKVKSLERTAEDYRRRRQGAWNDSKTRPTIHSPE